MTKKTPKIQTKHEEIAELQHLLTESIEREKRVLADYQNLVKRNQEERVKFLQLANKSLVETLLSPLEHLSMAAEQLDDQGLNMVIRDFWQVLEEAGLEEIYPKGKNFDLETMEVVDKEGEGEEVTKVVKRGYQLNGQVIQHAKVVVK
ncbi:MAG: nucleotide exchange factor GrpE [Candidatus Pacebacteria bacterium]|jgi:molecular chaperone GrpE|nr:nucleotide exchange factor GrpE [Candidatus Paceibacterota bacterium]MBT3511471.1 nucleotide exchange factor GrpE [Candidatus Paceibacterota bacterium]MBT4004676.1 nucleotide exchange factor GrpE [Candidatus Paceibacterota bacterium]MBT4358406.1 nucleotide exchange factor GrpE [Candidatus Paceibacterota bacterium]MBT4680841.1 nucleotide exchange factor GrpE [Candidatus Paceibacterota bacterium]